jgi:hypothetical protein
VLRFARTQLVHLFADRIQARAHLLLDLREVHAPLHPRAPLVQVVGELPMESVERWCSAAVASDNDWQSFSSSGSGDGLRSKTARRPSFLSRRGKSLAHRRQAQPARQVTQHALQAAE